MKKHHIRPLNPERDAEVELVAARMRLTLEEVLGGARGQSLYTMEWLIARVRWHLDPTQSTAQVLVAHADSGQIEGHTIVRVERTEEGRIFGLFSTTYVIPEARRHGIAGGLLAHGEAWMRAHSLPEAVTYTANNNTKLINLYLGRGYALEDAPPEMVRLFKAL